MSPAHPPTPGAQPLPGNQRFEIIEALVAEHLRQGRSPTLDGWLAGIRTRLDGLAASAGPRERRTAEKIGAAYASAAELVTRLAREQGGS